MDDKKFIFGIGIVTVIIMFGGIFLISKNNSPEAIQTNLSQNKEILTLKEDDYTKGSANANVVLVEYLDFECEACGAYYPQVKKISAEFGEDILIVSRYFPLPGHRNGMAAALAVEAAGRQGKYWEMHDLLFERQGEWGEKQKEDKQIFEQYANELGLSMEQFKQDRDSQEVKDRVNRDLQSGKSLGVRGTPSFFLNGEKIPNPKGFEDFKSLIEAASLKNAQTSTQ